MGDKDIISKDILKRIALDIARVLLNLQVDHAEIIVTEYARVEDRRADLVARMSGAEGEFILHIELQNDNDTTMPVRMLRYRTDIYQGHVTQDIRQYLIYIGRARLTMKDRIQQTGLDYHYRIIDMHTVDCQALLAQDNPDALVLAILCDFGPRPATEVIHFIIGRLHQLTADNEGRFRSYLRMLEILSTNRNFGNIIKEELKMLSQVKYSQLPSYHLGWEEGVIRGEIKGEIRGEIKGEIRGEIKGEIRGEIKGEIKGEMGLLRRLLIRRFGPLDADTQSRLNQATLEQLGVWADNILEAATLEDVFKM